MINLIKKNLYEIHSKYTETINLAAKNLENQEISNQIDKELKQMKEFKNKIDLIINDISIFQNNQQSPTILQNEFLNLSNELMKPDNEDYKDKIKNLDEEINNTKQRIETLSKENLNLKSIYHSLNEKSNIRRHTLMAQCPICKSNYRNAILITCGHAFCKSCLSKKEKKCPLCNIEFDDNQIKPFILNYRNK